MQQNKYEWLLKIYAYFFQFCMRLCGLTYENINMTSYGIKWPFHVIKPEKKRNRIYIYIKFILHKY